MSALHYASYMPISALPILAIEDVEMVKQVKLSFADLDPVLAYCPDTGAFTWKQTTSTRAKAGSSAGTWLMNPKVGKEYLSITFRGRKLSAAQVAWLLYYGSWPDRSVFYLDENPRNLKIGNLKMADHKAVRVAQEDGSIKYKMSQEQSRHYGLVRNYGISMTQYADMFAKQGGVCAICGKPETHKVPGRKRSDGEVRLRDLSVDHCHDTGAIRELLCNACNHVLGSANDDPDVLRKAADYIEKHRALKQQ